MALSLTVLTAYLACLCKSDRHQKINWLDLYDYLMYGDDDSFNNYDYNTHSQYYYDNLMDDQYASNNYNYYDYLNDYYYFEGGGSCKWLGIGCDKKQKGQKSYLDHAIGAYKAYRKYKKNKGQTQTKQNSKHNIHPKPKQDIKAPPKKEVHPQQKIIPKQGTHGTQINHKQQSKPPPPVQPKATWRCGTKCTPEQLKECGHCIDKIQIFPGFTDERYQQYDQCIADVVKEFNANKKGFCDKIKEDQIKRYVQDVEPDRFKSLLIEINGGSPTSFDFKSWNTNPGKVEVASSGKSEDDKIMDNLRALLKKWCNGGYAAWEGSWTYRQAMQSLVGVQGNKNVGGRVFECDKKRRMEREAHQEQLREEQGY